MHGVRKRLIVVGFATRNHEELETPVITMLTYQNMQRVHRIAARRWYRYLTTLAGA